jgi:hypothetical protein
MQGIKVILDMVKIDIMSSPMAKSRGSTIKNGWSIERCASPDWIEKGFPLKKDELLGYFVCK